MDPDLVELLESQPMACSLWPEQTEGPYHRDLPPDRTNIREDRQGVRLRLALRLVAATDGRPLAGVGVEVWHADHEGRYSGFKPFQARPGEVVTSESVAREIVAANEMFLRGVQGTDESGMCAFRTIYPGWYSSRAVHVHVRARFGKLVATTQLYFPEDVTDEVFAAPPYADRPPRDTTNDTDSIFNEEDGKDAVLELRGSVTDGYTAVICLAVAEQEM